MDSNQCAILVHIVTSWMVLGRMYWNWDRQWSSEQSVLDRVKMHMVSDEVKSVYAYMVLVGLLWNLFFPL